MNKIWKIIEDYENEYEISEYGDVYSIKRLVNSPNGTRTVGGIYLKPYLRKDGYFEVKLAKNGKRKTYLVHILVAVHFNGYIQNGRGGIVIDHDDSNKFNNHYTNLKLIHNRINSAKIDNQQTSKHIGVCLKKDKWIARIIHNRKRIYLGAFDNEDDAGIAYKNYYNNKIAIFELL